MKKICSFLLMLAVCFSVCACGGSTTPDDAQASAFSVGIARESIMPQSPLKPRWICLPRQER